ncbi:DUF3137 domain-containing protein [Campylobacter sp. MOP7]|uniref:DUF3137 domain-containing protein n=1 Tax=Campylobacter canis TaxID=3378588 RepID=UPI00387E9C32
MQNQENKKPSGGLIKKLLKGVGIVIGSFILFLIILSVLPKTIFGFSSMSIVAYLILGLILFFIAKPFFKYTPKSQKAQKIWNIARIVVLAVLAISLSFGIVGALVPEQSQHMVAQIISYALAGAGLFYVLKRAAKYKQKSVASEELAKNSINQDDLARLSQSRNLDLVNELENLEKERLQLLATMQKSKIISIAVGVVALLITYFIDESYAGPVGVVVYALTNFMLTETKEREFKGRFKQQIISAIVQSYGLRYSPSGGVGLDDFLQMYKINVNKHEVEDFIHGEIDGVSVKFSDFVAYEDMNKMTLLRVEGDEEFTVRFKGVIFVADFNKQFSDVTVVNHKKEFMLNLYGHKVHMDNVKFEEMFNTYSTDEVSARYVLSPLLMERLEELGAKFNAPLSALFKDNKLYIAANTGRDHFEASYHHSFANSATIMLYENEIRLFADIVKELKLNRKIWTN